jgi:pimeloyl-ACP methyl ester carboxylesterase
MKIFKGTAECDSFSMDYFRFGSGTETLVILPGLSVLNIMPMAALVASSYEIFSKDFTVYLFERRSDPPQEYTVSDMAGDTCEAVQKLGLSGICLYGVSQGGMIAMRMCIDESELVKKLVLASTASRVTANGFRTVEKWVRLAEENKIRELFLIMGEDIYPPEFFSKNRDAFRVAAGMTKPEDLKRFIILAKGMRDFDVTSELHRIKCPVLLAGSSDDRVTGAEAFETMAERMKISPDFRKIQYDGYGHAMYDTCPDFKPEMLRFLLDGKKSG